MSKKKKITISAVLATVLLLGMGALFLHSSSNVVTVKGNADVGKYENFSVEQKDERVNVLVLGMRGAGNGENGALLADSIMLFSFDKEKEEAAMISVPRDLYVKIPEHPNKEKINYAYALGEQRSPGGGGLSLTKEVVQYVTGVHIDHAVVANFEGFEEVVDIVGGVEVYRDRPFYESQQWQFEGNPNSPYWFKQQNTATNDTSSLEENATGTSSENPPEYWVFHVPAGRSVLDGESALYYVRSRFTSNDFERMERQQEVMKSLKSKIFSLGILSNPSKVFQILDSLGRNVRTDMSLGEINEVISLAQQHSDMDIKSITLDTSENGMLRSKTSPQGAYILVPKTGEFDKIREEIKNIFNNNQQ